MTSDSDGDQLHRASPRVAYANEDVPRPTSAVPEDSRNGNGGVAGGASDDLAVQQAECSDYDATSGTMTGLAGRGVIPAGPADAAITTPGNDPVTLLERPPSNQGDRIDVDASLGTGIAAALAALTDVDAAAVSTPVISHAAVMAHSTNIDASHVDGSEAVSPEADAAAAAGATAGDPAAPKGDAEPKRPLSRASAALQMSDAKRPRLPPTSEDSPRTRTADVDVATFDVSEAPPEGQQDDLPMDIVLRIEFAKSGEMKFITFLMVASLMVGIAVTVYIKMRTSRAGTSWYLIDSDKPQFRDNYITGFICTIVSGCMWLLYVVRGCLFRLWRLRWEPRRHRIFMSRFAELTAVVISFACWTYSCNARRMERDCESFNQALVWTYAVRLTTSNTLLCIWVMAIRGMTVSKGGPLSIRERVRLSLRRNVVKSFKGLGACCAVKSNGSEDAVTARGIAASAPGQPRKGVGGGMRGGVVLAATPAASPSEPDAAPHRTSADEAAEVPPDEAPRTASVEADLEREGAGTTTLVAAAVAALEHPAAPYAAGPRTSLQPAAGAGAVAAAATVTAAAKPEHKSEVATLAASTRAAVRAAAEMATESGQDEQLYIDAPWWEYLAPVAWIWVPFQCLVGINIALVVTQMGTSTGSVSCLEWFLECRGTNRASFVFMTIVLFAEAFYVAIYFGYSLSAFSYLRSRSYVLYRQLNIYLSVEVRIRGVALLFLLANVFVQALFVPTMTLPNGIVRRCRYSLDAYLGLWSTEAVTLVVVCIVAWIYIPRRIKGDLPIMQATLQRFSWTEADLPRQLARRMASMPDCSDRITKLQKEPMFCFETAVKLTYWCEHAYYYEEPGCQMRVPLETLMGLYGLDHIEVMRNEDTDTKVMIAWNWKLCLLCFRGTASLKAACVDLKAMLVPYYQVSAWKPKYTMAALAAVHHGFQWSWTHGDFNRGVLDWVRDYRQRHPHGKIIVTGHSLGGAHASLCTMDIIRELGASLPYNHITCYTFGSPRVGNHAFAALYNKVVYETWHVINGNDMVPLTPKFVGWFVYKQPGHKVIVKRRGDLIVRPTFTENTVARMPCSRSVRQHLLASYLRSMMAVMRSQTRGKHMEGGVRGLLHLSSYQLPEVDGVLRDLVREVNTVVFAAGEAVTLAGSRSLSSREITPQQAGAAAAAAAAAAGHGGHTVLHFMAKHGSIRLLMDQELLAKLGELEHDHGPAPAPQPVEERPHEPLAKQLLVKVMHGINIGMQLMGVETGMDDGEDGTVRGDAAAPPGLASTDTVGEAEMAAFEKAVAGRSAAQLRYKHNKELRHRELRSDVGVGKRWVSAFAAGMSGSITARGKQRRPDGEPAAAAQPRQEPQPREPAAAGRNGSAGRRRVIAVRRKLKNKFSSATRGAAPGTGPSREADGGSGGGAATPPATAPRVSAAAAGSAGPVAESLEEPGSWTDGCAGLAGALAGDRRGLGLGNADGRWCGDDAWRINYEVHAEAALAALATASGSAAAVRRALAGERRAVARARLLSEIGSRRDAEAVEEGAAVEGGVTSSKAGLDEGFMGGAGFARQDGSDIEAGGWGSR